MKKSNYSEVYPKFTSDITPYWRYIRHLSSDINKLAEIGGKVGDNNG